MVFLVPVVDPKDPTRSSKTKLLHASGNRIRLIAKADRIGYPAIVDGELAYHTQNHAGTRVTVVWGNRKFGYAGSMRPWLKLDFIDRDKSRTPPLLVFGLDTPDGKWSLWVNLQKVCEWNEWDNSECLFDPETGILTIKPDRERTFKKFEPQTFNLRELGIIP